MTRARQAVNIGVIYSLPLLFWFVTQLQLIDAGGAGLATLSRQTLLLLLLLQCLSMALLFSAGKPSGLRDDLLSLLLVLAFPLPVFAILWLFGNLSPEALLRGLLLVSAVGAVAISIQAIGSRMALPRQLLQTGLIAAQMTLGILLWNFRHLWQEWIA